MSEAITVVPEVIDVPEKEVQSNTALTKIVSAEADQQIITAKKYPRSLAKFKQNAIDMATLDTETAAGCFYKLSRSGKTIEGPSVRLAEIVQSCWGNIRAGARIVNDDGRMITSQGYCWDLERNVQVSVEVQRRVTDRNGKRYSDDMIVVTANAANAIAFRNAVFKVIPMAYTHAILDRAKQVAIGDAKTLSERRDKMVAAFGKMGVNQKQILGKLGKAGIEDITLENLEELIGLHTAIRDGDTTIDEAFAAEPVAPPTPGRMTFKPKMPTIVASPVAQPEAAPAEQQS